MIWIQKFNLKTFRMFKTIKIFLVLYLFPISIYAQNSIDSVLVQIERNNTSLSAWRKQGEAQKLGNKKGIYLNNPEFEFNYLWGNPSSFGNRTDISIKQSFDFPTAYAYKNQISNLRNQQVDLEYLRQHKALLLEARSVCIDLIYAKAVKTLYANRLVQAESIAKSVKAEFEIGETNILEFNKSQINLLNIKKEAELNDIEHSTLLSQLVALNGGLPIVLDDSVFQIPEIPVDFEQWFLEAEQKNPTLSWIKQEIEISQKQVKLNSASSFPKFYAGYMSEKVVGQHFQGITAGISIPLWENKNTIKQSKAQTMALQDLALDNKLQFYNQLKAQHSKAVVLQKSLVDYRMHFQKFDNATLLKKAFDKGEISLSEYIMELSFFYSSVNNLLQTERELNKTAIQLIQYMD